MLFIWLLVRISIHLMLLFIGRRWLCINADLLFQYISCYCLSVFYGVLLLNPFQFQYISCYCLSIHFISYCTYSFYFNTSHVTVYPIYTPNIFLASSISIHLMLLFIPALQGRHLLSLQFQYISCYCLSERRRL